MAYLKDTPVPKPTEYVRWGGDSSLAFLGWVSAACELPPECNVCHTIHPHDEDAA